MKTIYIVIATLFLGACHGKPGDTQATVKNHPGPPQAVLVKNEQGEAVSNSKELQGVNYAIYAISKEGLESMFHEEADEYDNFSCFYLDIRIDNLQDIVAYPSPTYPTTTDKTHYLSFSIKDYMSIEAGGKTYKCINSTFDRTYGKVPYSRFFLVFNKIKEAGDMTFKFNDNYFNNGEINLKL